MRIMKVVRVIRVMKVIRGYPGGAPRVSMKPDTVSGQRPSVKKFPAVPMRVIRAIRVIRVIRIIRVFRVFSTVTGTDYLGYWVIRWKECVCLCV